MAGCFYEILVSYIAKKMKEEGEGVGEREMKFSFLI